MSKLKDGRVKVSPNIRMSNFFRNVRKSSKLIFSNNPSTFQQRQSMALFLSSNKLELFSDEVDRFSTFVVKLSSFRVFWLVGDSRVAADGLLSSDLVNVEVSLVDVLSFMLAFGLSVLWLAGWLTHSVIGPVG